jgi:hypothetical protein
MQELKFMALAGGSVRLGYGFPMRFTKNLEVS